MTGFQPAYLQEPRLIIGPDAQIILKVEDEDENEEVAEDKENELESEIDSDDKEKDSDEEELEEPDTPLTGKDLIQHLRKLHKADAKEKRELKSQLEAEIEAKAQEEDKPVEKINPSDVFRGLVEVNNGDREKSFLPTINEQIDMMTMADLAVVKKKASASQFGDLSEDVLDVVRERTPDVMLQESIVSKESKAEDDWKKTRKEAWDDVKSISGMNDKNSKIYQSFVEAEQDLFSRFPNIKLQADAPLKILEHSELLQRASKSPKLSALEKEVKQLRKQLNISQGGSDSNGSKKLDSSSKQEETPEEELARRIEGMRVV